MRRGWLAICDRCGFEYHSFQLRKEWNGLMVCRFCWEPKHPQLFVKAKTDKQTPPWTRPEQADVFISPCYLEGTSCYAGLAVAGCAIAGNQTYSVQFLLDLLDGPP